MIIDRYRKLGSRYRTPSWQATIDFVRQTYPRAYAEGSMGPERTWWIRELNAHTLVAHSWPVRAREVEGPHYVRLRPLEAQQGETGPCNYAEATRLED